MKTWVSSPTCGVLGSVNLVKLFFFVNPVMTIQVICYILLSGFSPFMGETDSDTFANITRCFSTNCITLALIVWFNHR